jgi:hypothetical protein
MPGCAPERLCGEAGASFCIKYAAVPAPPIKPASNKKSERKKFMAAS